MTDVNSETGGGGGWMWREAGLADGLEVLGLMREFYAEEGLVFDGAKQGRALDALLADAGRGAVFLLEKAGGGEVAGHLVLTWGHSLEFGGRFGLLDEVYVAPARRGRGEGRRALERAEAWARAGGAGALRLEVARGNGRARATYERAGFAAETRDLMTLRLA